MVKTQRLFRERMEKITVAAYRMTSLTSISQAYDVMFWDTTACAITFVGFGPQRCFKEPSHCDRRQRNYFLNLAHRKNSDLWPRRIRYILRFE